MRRHPHIEPHADDLLLLRQGRELSERAVDMMTRRSLVTGVMLGRGEETIGHHQIDRIAGVCRQTGEAPGKFERGAKIAIVELINAQAPEGAQLVDRVVEAFRELQCRRPGGAGLSGAADAVHQRPAERIGKLHAWPRGCRFGAFEPAKCPFDPLAALAQQRQLDPQRHNRNGQRHSDLRVTVGRKRPIETGAHIVEMPTVNGQPLSLRS